jgi:hypothetical protein
MGNDNCRLAGLIGLAFIAAVVVSFAIAGERPDPLISVAAGTLFVFFGGYLREVLHGSEGGRGTLATVAFAGAAIVAVQAALDGSVTIALVEAADDVDPAAVQALSALWINTYPLFFLGAALFLLATGISVVRHGALPKPIGWIAIVLGLAAVTPAGFVTFLGGLILIAVISVILTAAAGATGAKWPCRARPDMTASGSSANKATRLASSQHSVLEPRSVRLG